ncbi:hypothetical protein BVY04_01760 [bacterium M21]|nr:hypothetical protein BVY04_01760 [bacterium M21]
MMSNSIKPTVRGWIVCVAASVAIILGAILPSVAAFQVCFCLLAVMSLAFIWSAANLRGLSVNLDLPNTAYGMERFDVRWSVNNERRLLPAVDVELEAEMLGNGIYFAPSSIYRSGPRQAYRVGEIAPGGAHGFTQLVGICKRGAYEHHRCRLVSIFPLGLFRASMETVVKREITVFPSPRRELHLPGFPGSEFRSAEDQFAAVGCAGDFRGLREFSQGDSLRMVHWALSAKHQHLVVPEFEYSSGQNVIVLAHSYRCPSSAIEHQFEEALEITSGIVEQLLKAGRKVTFLADFTHWEVTEIEDRRMQEKLNVCLAHATPGDREILRSGVRRISDLARSGMPLIVIGDTSVRHWQKFFRAIPQHYCLSPNEAH